MSEQKEARKAQEESEAEPDSGQSPEVAEDQPSAGEGRGAEAANKAAARRGGNALAWFALLLALAACGLAGWQWWLSFAQPEAGRVDSRMAEQASDIQSQSQRVDRLDERVEGVEGRFDSLASELEQLEVPDFDPAQLRSQVQSESDARADLEQRVAALSERLDESVSSLESRIEEAGAARSGQIQESLAEARFRLALVEVAGLLRLGQSRVELAGDPAGAVAAYQRAQARLEGIDDARVSRLRSLVAEELEALRSIDTPDWPELAGRLSVLESESARWPAAVVDEPSPETTASVETGTVEGGWWSSIRSSLSGLVRVTPRESAPLTSAAVESVRERVRLHLAAAQAAAARRSAEEMSRHLEVSADLIRRHFDTAADAVSSALATLAEGSSVRAPELPELGGALAEAERRLAAS